MASKYREEIVGKRFLSVSGFSKIKLGKISEWGWRAGVIRAASHRDNSHKDLQVLVEYDDVEWHRREWINIYKTGLFNIFLVEHTLVWTERRNPYCSNPSTILWPALSFSALVTTVDISEDLQPIEYLPDKELVFRDYCRLQPVQDWETAQSSLQEYPQLQAAVHQWQEQQDGQRILLATPSVLVGYRVEVYRAEGTTQWYTAVIVGYNEATKDLTVTDDTVLEEHNEDPALVQMKLIGDGVVESIMRGENVGVTSRRSRSSSFLMQTQQSMSRGSRVNTSGCNSIVTSSVGSVALPSITGTRHIQQQQLQQQNQSTSIVGRRPRATARHCQQSTATVLHPLQHQSETLESASPDALDKGGTVTKCFRKKKSSESDVSKQCNVTHNYESCIKEEVGDSKQNKKRINIVKTQKNKETVEDTLTKLQDVDLQTDNCLQITGNNSEIDRNQAQLPLATESQKTPPDCREFPLIADVINKDDEGNELSVSTIRDVNSLGNDEAELEEENDDDDCVIVAPPEVCTDVARSLRTEPPITECSSRDDDDGPLSSSSPFSRMELTDTSSAALLRFPDDRSDSGVSSLRSGSCASGDERSGSRSSALSSSDEPQTHGQCQPATTRSPLFDKYVVSASGTTNEPVRVWRDPSLLLDTEPHVRHIHSVQHQSLLMSHPPGSAPGRADPALPPPVASATALYPGAPPPPPPLLSPYPLHHVTAAHNLPLTDMLWKRYPPLPVTTHLLGTATHPAAEELMERERAYAQDRERQERLHRERERREQEVRELEKQHKEREKERIERERERQEKMERDREREKQAERERQDRLERDQERERQEKQRAAEQAVHKHFEESLRLAHQKVGSIRGERSGTSWNLINSLPPPQRNNAVVSVVEEERKRIEHDHQREQHRQLTAAERLRHERTYYTPQTVQRPPSASNKTEYPPPAHSRTSCSVKPGEKIPSNHPVLPKAEPSFNMFGYPAYQPVGFMSHEPKMKHDHHKTSPSTSSAGLVIGKNSSAISVDNRDRDIVGPPPLMSELKSTVIVKHDGKSPHHLDPKVSLSHSPSPKLRTGDMISHYLPASATQHKPSLYEYRSPSQSPHHMAHPHVPSPLHHVDQKNMSLGHHRSSGQLPSPHAHHQRQSPHPHMQPSHPSPPDNRYSRADAQILSYPSNVKPTVSGGYPYLPQQGSMSSGSHYSLSPSVSVSSGSKPKVNSVPHVYGKPTAGIVSGIPVCRIQDVSPPGSTVPMTSKLPLSSSVSPSPYQQVSQYHPPHPPPPSIASSQHPPPAHSSRTNTIVTDHRIYDRIYPSGLVPGGLSVKPVGPPHHGTSPPTASAASSPVSRSPHQLQNLPPPLPGHHSTMASVQTQPLDLGVSSDRNSNRDERVGSPKRKSISIHHPIGSPVASDIKKRRIESPSTGINLHVQSIAVQNNPLSIHGSVQPQLARVSEPSPLIASAATTITTVVNTAAYCSPATSMVISQPQLAGDDMTLGNIPVGITTLSTQTGHGENIRPSSTESNSSISAIATTIAISNSSPVPTLVPTSLPATSNGSTVATSPSTKVSLTPSVVDSEKSNSPGPAKSSSGSYPVRHLKKAWLQRHTGEDVEDTTGITGGGSCVTLPIAIANAPPPTSSAQSKEASPSVTTSLQNIGSMAVNSISKSGKNVNNKGNRKNPPTKEIALNGHTVEVNKADDSSSSDQERGHKSPPKRKPPKRKKGGGAVRKSNVEELKKKKSAPQAAIVSESGSDSDKETGSDKDSDSAASGNQLSGKKTTNGGTGNTSHNTVANKEKEPKKRGRRPKSSKNDKGEEPRSKKPRDDPPAPPRDPFRKPPVSQLKKTGESFLQDGPCFEVAPKLAKCRECRWTPNQRSKNMPNIFCRFYAFRRLRYTKNGQLAIAGFSDPYKDATEDDVKLWLPIADSPPADLDQDMSRFLLRSVGDQFCDLLLQEKDAHSEHMSDEKTIAWKRVVQGVREMCDVCETTLFNFHWACGKCGFVVCLDCYKGRKNGTIKIWGESGKDRDDFSWLLCTNRQAHEQEKLMLTQIIAGDSLVKLGRKVHEARELWGIPQYCDCPLSKEVKNKFANGTLKDAIKSIIKSESNGVKQEKSDDIDKGVHNGGNIKQESDKHSRLSWLADVALSNEDKKGSSSDGSLSFGDSDDEKDGNFSTLRELLIRPSHKSHGSCTSSPAPANKHSNNKHLSTLDEVISCVIEDSLPEEERKIIKEMGIELKHYVRRYKWEEKGRDPLPIRIMTLTESKDMYPDVPHSWLCDGKLLRLTDPNNSKNYRIFQDQWKRGQPVIVSDVTRDLNKDLWHPESFARDFGDEKNDLINCMTGNLVPNQPMRKFWEGFEHFSKRLKDDRGNPMLLKLKDWPPGEDFAEMLPSRYNDLMKVLPLSEYTHRTGRLNLASRLPECFVRPDLGPKMYNAYGSALYPTKGTTNLHLDVSDAVNVMVYVGIPKDGDSDEHIKEAFRAIDEAGCDILTRRRVRDKGELPGALWHIYHARDADKIRDLLNKVALERGARLEPHHDPIHDQSCYLDGQLRERLYKEYNVEGYAIVQCLGDAVFIPAGAPHQVRNLHNCIKVAEDFVSPENISHCFHLTQEFRTLSDTHTNHEDKLQIKNIIYHAVKDSLSVIGGILDTSCYKQEAASEPGPGDNHNVSSSASSDSNMSDSSPASHDADSKEMA